MRTNQESTINFMYFGNNYPSAFIGKVWEDNPNLATHLQNKFSFMYNKYGAITFFKWFMELDSGNKVKLLNWIEKNYKS